MKSRASNCTNLLNCRILRFWDNKDTFDHTLKADSIKLRKISNLSAFNGFRVS